jgi:hypothetical protein
MNLNLQIRARLDVHIPALVLGDLLTANGACHFNHVKCPSGTSPLTLPMYFVRIRMVFRGCSLSA